MLFLFQKESKSKEAQLQLDYLCIHDYCGNEAEKISLENKFKDNNLLEEL